MSDEVRDPQRPALRLWLLFALARCATCRPGEQLCSEHSPEVDEYIASFGAAIRAEVGEFAAAIRASGQLAELPAVEVAPITELFGA